MDDGRETALIPRAHLQLTLLGRIRPGNGLATANFESFGTVADSKAVEAVVELVLPERLVVAVGFGVVDILSAGVGVGILFRMSLRLLWQRLGAKGALFEGLRRHQFGLRAGWGPGGGFLVPHGRHHQVSDR